MINTFWVLSFICIANAPTCPVNWYLFGSYDWSAEHRLASREDCEAYAGKVAFEQHTAVVFQCQQFEAIGWPPE
jgi:hypothetical protein